MATAIDVMLRNDIPAHLERVKDSEDGSTAARWGRRRNRMDAAPA
jgi:hypothetical protein